MIVEIASGRLQGFVADGVAAFKGVPYRQGVGGAGRWRRSSPVAAWSGVRNAFAYGPRAIQPESREMRTTSDAFEALMSAGGPEDDAWKGQDEECLTLNVWTPSVTAQTKLPVMFWCHGGKYFGETPPVWWFDGENLARQQEVVVVTIRHRVGVLGFLHLADLPGGSDYVESANVGLLDLVDGLQWVKDNIAAFGGDPDNVTIFGESGGGLKVSVLLRTPRARGLFHKAIIQSGAQIEAGSRDEGASRTHALLAELGLSPETAIQGLLETPARQLIQAQIRLLPNLFGPPTGARSAEFEPVVDGATLPSDSFDASAFPIDPSIPIMIGTCGTETTFFMSALPGFRELSHARMRAMVAGMVRDDSERVLSIYEAAHPNATPTDILVAVSTDYLFRRKAIRVAELKSRQRAAPAYMYLLAFETDVEGGALRTPHILDLPLVFAHPDHPILGSDPARFLLSRQMGAAWASFARHGDPSTSQLPPWPRYDEETRATMVFDAQPRVVFDPQAAERSAW